MAENGSGDQDEYSFTEDTDNLEALTAVTDSEAAALLDEPEPTAEEESDVLASGTSTADAEADLSLEAGGTETDGDPGEGVEDPELEAIKERVREMEEEAEKLKEMQSEVEKQMNLSGSSITSPTSQQAFPTIEEKLDADARSVYVGNVDYGATAQELEAHFHGCGSINRVTILVDKFTGSPKGFAYVEFGDKDSVQTAMALDESLFRGRQIKVSVKRTNRPGISSTDRGSRGRGRRGRNSFYYGYQPRRGRFRPRRTSYYSPY